MSDKNSQDVPHSQAEIKATLKDAQPNEAFCKVWPPAKEALLLLLDQVSNPALKKCINAVINVGDTHYQETCTQ